MDGTTQRPLPHRPECRKSQWEQQELTLKQAPLGRSGATMAALIRKTTAWWNLTQEERRNIFEKKSHHIAEGVRYLPSVARQLLERESDIEVVGEAANQPDAMALINSLEPQIVLTDFDVRSTGNTLAKNIRSKHPRTKVLGVTELKGRYVKSFLKIFGADELLDTRDLEGKLITTVRLVALG
jgi:hypothetical protein